MDSDAIDQADAMLISAEVTLRKVRESLNKEAKRPERLQWYQQLQGVVGTLNTIGLWLDPYDR